MTNRPYVSLCCVFVAGVTPVDERMLFAACAPTGDTGRSTIDGSSDRESQRRLAKRLTIHAVTLRKMVNTQGALEKLAEAQRLRHGLLDADHDDTAVAHELAVGYFIYLNWSLADGELDAAQFALRQFVKFEPDSAVRHRQLERTRRLLDNLLPSNRRIEELLNLLDEESKLKNSIQENEHIQSVMKSD